MKEAIRQRLNFYEIVRRHVELKPAGLGKFKGLSPFSKEKTPSFYIDVNRQVYYCFSSKQGGDVFDFLMKVENLSFNEVLYKLAEETGVPISRQVEDHKRDIFDLNKLALDYFQENLAIALPYLKERALSDQSIETFGLGFAPNSGFVRFAQKEGINPMELIKNGLANEDPATGRVFDRFKDRVIFPIRDHLGRVVAFGGRVFGDGKPKYLNSPETEIFKKSQTLYGLDLAKSAIRQSEEVIIVEGYFDVIAMHQMGFTNAVATLGTALTDDHGHLLARLGARKINLLFDNDEAGRTATLAGLDQELGRRFLVKAISLPSKDPAELLANNEVNQIKTALNSGLSEVDFRLNGLLKKFNPKTLEGKRQIVTELLPALRNRDIFDPVALELRRLTAEKLSLSPTRLNEWVEQKKNKVPNTTEIRGLLKHGANPELELAKLLLQNPNLVNKIDGEADFENPLIAEMVEMVRQGCSTQQIFGQLSGRNDANFLFESIFSANSLSLAPDQEELATKQVVSKTREAKLKLELAHLKAKIASTFGTELTDLLRQCSDLQRSIEAERRLRIRN